MAVGKAPGQVLEAIFLLHQQAGEREKKIFFKCYTMKSSTLSPSGWVDNSRLQETNMLNVTGAGSNTEKYPNSYY